MTVQFSLRNFLLGLWMLTISPLLTAGLTDAVTGSWFDPKFDGAGFIIEALADDRAAVFWFTYDNSGNQAWYTGVGSSSENSITIDELYVTDGGIFGDAFDPNSISQVDVGSATFTFDDCNHANVDFTVEGTSSSQTLTRLTAVRDLDCDNPVVSPERPLFNQTGSWFDLQRSGEGFIVEVLADQRVAVFWFTYDPSGNQVWLTGIGHAAGSFIHVEEMLITRNGLFGPEHNPEDVEFEVWGSVELQLDCISGTAIYDAIDPSWGRGDHTMTRLTEVAGLSCVHDDYTVVAGRDLTGLWQSDGFGYAAKIDANGFSIMQHTASSCLEVAGGPMAELESAGDDLLFSRFGDRLLFSGLDSVSPVRFDKVESLPVVCLDGDSGFSIDSLYNFNVFRDTFTELYSAFDIRNVDWKAQIDQYQGSINPNTTSRSLFNTFSNMLRPLQDGHVSIVALPDVFHVNSVGHAELRDRAFQPAVDNILRNSYLNGTRLVAANGVLRYGMLGDGVAYLEVTRLNNILDNASTNQVREFLRGELDDVFAWFKDRTAVGLVVDVRRNDGGNTAFGLEIAGRLNRGPSRIVFSERRPTANGDTEAIATALTATEGEGFDGPIALLTSALTASAAETFTLSVRAIPQVTSIGTPSNGVLSRTERVLPNGWIVSITAGHVEAPNGDRYEAVGIPVDIQTPVFTSSDIEANLDSAVDMALTVLK